MRVFMKVRFNWLFLLPIVLLACENSSFVDGQGPVSTEQKSEDLLAEADVDEKEDLSGDFVVDEESDPAEEIRPESPAPPPEPEQEEPPVEEKDNEEELIDEPQFIDQVKEFTYGDPNPQVDYLFIIDNSSSMNGVLGQIIPNGKCL